MSANVMKYIIFTIFILASYSLMAQGSIGLEIRSSSNITYNQGELISSITPYESNEILAERNPLTTSYSIGLVFNLTQNIIFKMHVGQHRNGRILDLLRSDYYGTNEWNGVNLPFIYLQFVPSVSYTYRFGKNRIPFELGLAINRFTDHSSVILAFINEYNYDIRSSIG